MKLVKINIIEKSKIWLVAIYSKKSRLDWKEFVRKT